MKKKIIALLFALVLCLCTAVPAFAADGFADEYYRVNDLADLLTDSEKAALLQKLDEISLRQKMDVTVATVNDLDGYSTATEYADVVYEYCNFGYGADKDGLLLLISMEDRDWAISTCGYGITAFTDAGIEYIGKQIKSDLSDGNYAAAFDTYANLCDEFITQARSGSPFDRGNLPREPLSMIWIPISIVIGVVLALIIVGSMKGKLKTVRTQAAANSYLKKGSLAITESSDLFLYHTVDRKKREKDNDSGSGTHTSSSGTTHGGGSGKF
mgnify:CR=1 FL=1